MNNRYYANIEGVDNKAIAVCLYKANKICDKDNDIKSIVLYCYTKENFDTLAQFLGIDINKMFSQPLNIRGVAKPIQCLTERTYKDSTQNSSIVICCYMDSKSVLKVDDYHSAKYIMAISWLKDELAEWVTRWNAECIYGDEIKNVSIEDDDDLNLLRVALKEMDDRMHGTKDLNHPYDENTCKTYIRTIYKYLPEVNPVQIEDILVSNLNWKNKNAAQVSEFLSRLKNGRTFQGGDKTGLGQYYKRWKAMLEKGH